MTGTLGRYIAPDMRDAAHRMSTDLGDVIKPLYGPKWWDRGFTPQQAKEGACVGGGWLSWYNSKPKGFYNPLPNDELFQIYYAAKRIDEWPGEDYSGTSVRAGAKVMQSRGFLTEYVWATSGEEIRQWLRAYGPVVIGSDWLKSMDTPRASDGMLSVDYASGVRGGHCTCLYGVGDNDDVIGVNNWGDDWGKEGSFQISRTGLDLLIRHGLEACASRQTGIRQ